MNGEDFYREFKEALAYFGRSWGAMSAMKVTIREGSLCFEYQGKKILLGLGS